MSITYPLFLPVPIKSDRFGLNINKAQFSGEFTRNRISQSHGAGTTDRWEGVYTTPFLSSDQHREMSAWLTSMSVDDGTFFAFNPNVRAFQGTYSDGGNLLGADAEPTQIVRHFYYGISLTEGHPLSGLNLRIGDAISLSGLVWSTDALGVNLRVATRYFDIDGELIRSTFGNLVTLSDVPTESKIDGDIIPKGTTNISIFNDHTSGISRSKEMILTKTATAQTFVSYLKVDGASQTGTTLAIKDGGASAKGILRVGTIIQVENQLYEVSKTVATDGSGNATIEIRPAIRTSHPDNEPIVIRNTTMIAQLVQTDHPQETNHNSVGVISFAWQEVV